MSYSHELSSVEARLAQYSAAARAAAQIEPDPVAFHRGPEWLADLAVNLIRRPGEVCVHLAECRVQPAFTQSTGGLACAACDDGTTSATCDRCGRSGELVVVPVRHLLVFTVRVALCWGCAL